MLSDTQNLAQFATMSAFCRQTELLCAFVKMSDHRPSMRHRTIVRATLAEPWGSSCCPVTLVICPITDRMRLLRGLRRNQCMTEQDRMRIVRCGGCGQKFVPEVLLATIEPTVGLQTVGKGALIQSRVWRELRQGNGDQNASIVSDALPFLEFELFRQVRSVFCVELRCPSLW